MPTPNAAAVYRDYETDGVPSSGAHNVLKSDVRNYLSQVEASLALVDDAVSSDLTNASYRATYAARSVLFTFAI
jgi:hypothetical protein